MDNIVWSSDSHSMEFCPPGPLDPLQEGAECFHQTIQKGRSLVRLKLFLTQCATLVYANVRQDLPRAHRMMAWPADLRAGRQGLFLVSSILSGACPPYHHRLIGRSSRASSTPPTPLNPFACTPCQGPPGPPSGTCTVFNCNCQAVEVDQHTDSDNQVSSSMEGPGHYST